LLKIIRMMKWWNARHNHDRLKGIHLETLVVRSLDGRQLDGWANTLHFLFASLTHTVRAECPDPTGLGRPLDSTLSDQDRTASVSALLRAHSIAVQASEFAKANNNALALGAWQLLFPLYF
jgi:hypothetical protein